MKQNKVNQLTKSSVTKAISQDKTVNKDNNNNIANTDNIDNIDNTGNTESDKLTIIYSTFSNRQNISDIATILLQSNKIVCVNIIPNISSIFLWEDTITEEQEYIALFKTIFSHHQSVIDIIKQHHEYKLPVIFSFTATQVEQNYLTWLSNNIK